MSGELIYELFRAIASEAMDKGQSVTLRYDADQGESETIISSSKRDESILSLSVYPVSKETEEDETEEDPQEDDEEEED